jgi:hypothetical protein
VSDKITPVPDLYCVAIQRYPRDLGVSIVLPATSEMMARREALRLFPEHKRGLALMQVSLVRYVELDWDSSRFTVAKRERPPAIPHCVATAVKPNRKKLRPFEQEGDV